MKPVDGRTLERVRYWQGQMLRARDFREQLSEGAQHRWWHNRALHDAYGVYEGLEVSPAGSAQPLKAVTVYPGIAYDCFGRELVAERQQTIPLPENLPPNPERKNVLVLLLQYRPEDECTCDEDLKEVCWWARRNSIRSSTLLWKLREFVRLEDGVPLALVRHAGGSDSSLESAFVPRPARALSMPLIGHGVTLPQSTIWEPWLALPPESAVAGSRAVGLQTQVDTSGAGFTEVPNYFAWISGEIIPILFPSVTGESSQGFTFQICLLVLETRGDTIFSALSDSGRSRALGSVSSARLPERLNLSVEWLGCQMPPRVRRKRLLNISALESRSGQSEKSK
jgi:hypothetical protein